MEKKIVFELSQKSALYLCKHFINLSSTEQKRIEEYFTIDQISSLMSEIGSKFLSEFVKGPFDLISLLNRKSPKNIIKQDNGRTAFIFEFSLMVGTCSLIELIKIPEKHRINLKKICRGNNQVWSFHTKERFFTNQIVLITDNNSVITCFPGIFAPPLPSLELPESLKNESTEFWQKHSFIQYEE